MSASAKPVTIRKLAEYFAAAKTYADGSESLIVFLERQAALYLELNDLSKYFTVERSTAQGAGQFAFGLIVKPTPEMHGLLAAAKAWRDDAVGIERPSLAQHPSANVDDGDGIHSEQNIPSVSEGNRKDNS